MNIFDTVKKINSQYTIDRETEKLVNARLIAAAPELYEAAKILESLMKNDAGTFRIQTKDIATDLQAGIMIAKFISAIAKAEGN